jgi:hypothetical protein
MSIVALKNGGSVDQTRLNTVMKKLEELKQNDSGAFYIFCSKCLGEEFSSQKKKIQEQIAYLQRLQLLDANYEIPTDIKDIVLSAIQWKGQSVKILDPRKITSVSHTPSHHSRIVSAGVSSSSSFPVQARL